MSATMPAHVTPDDTSALLFTPDALRQFQFCLRTQERSIEVQVGASSVGMLLTVGASEYAHEAGHANIERSDVTQACACLSRLLGGKDSRPCLHIAPGATSAQQSK